MLVNDTSISVTDQGRRFESDAPLTLSDLDAVFASGADFAGPFDIETGAAVLDVLDKDVLAR